MARRARARLTDPAASREAAATIGELTENEQAVLRVFLMEPRFMLDEELVAAYEHWSKALRLPRQSESGIRSRRAAIFKERHVLVEGEKKVMSTGGKGRTFAHKNHAD